MYVTAKYPFSRIYGLEKSNLLATACNHILKCLFGDDERFRVWNLDATEMDLDQGLWKNIQECTYVYIYNSFPQAVTKKDLQLLQEKCEQIHWKVTIMYAAPSKGPLIEMLKSEAYSLEDIIAVGPRQLVYVFDSVYKNDL